MYWRWMRITHTRDWVQLYWGWEDSTDLQHKLHGPRLAVPRVEGSIDSSDISKILISRLWFFQQ